MPENNYFLDEDGLRHVLTLLKEKIGDTIDAIPTEELQGWFSAYLGSNSLINAEFSETADVEAAVNEIIGE